MYFFVILCVFFGILDVFEDVFIDLVVSFCVKLIVVFFCVDLFFCVRLVIVDVFRGVLNV